MEDDGPSLIAYRDMISKITGKAILYRVGFKNGVMGEADRNPSPEAQLERKIVLDSVRNDRPDFSHSDPLAGAEALFPVKNPKRVMIEENEDGFQLASTTDAARGLINALDRVNGTQIGTDPADFDVTNLLAHQYSPWRG